LAGLALGLVAIWLITHTPRKEGSGAKAALLLGALAGIGFGTQLILFKFAPRASRAAPP
jgi:NhaP-type Na+/H+ or K+/H+ antiporter